MDKNLIEPNRKRIFLSPPHMGGEELKFVQEAFESNYIAPVGPMVEVFEREFAEYVGLPHAVAVSSGTAAIHLALRILGIGLEDEVITSTLTFIGSVTPVIFQGASLVFVDCDRTSWNMDPDLLRDTLEDCKRRGKMPKAVVPTDLYGQCCDLPQIVSICKQYNIPVVCDSAEALGAFYQKSEVGSQKSGKDRGQKSEKDRDQISDVRDQISKTDLRSPTSGLWNHAGVRARAAVYSFNGNKIITTSGGGMLASDDKEFIDYARKLSQQAREDFAHYEHEEIGYNYRMSNILAAIGRGQLKVLDERVKRKREIFDYYREVLGNVSGIEFMPEAGYGRCNRWLTVILITPEEFGADREEVRLALDAEDIEARPVWKPMHLQPVFDCRSQRSEVRGQKGKRQGYPARIVGGSVAEDLFERGLCLPSGTAMTDADLERIVRIILGFRS